MKIIGRIINGIKNFKFVYNREDMRELVEIQKALISRLAVADEEAKDNMLKAITEIDKIFGR